MHIQLDENTKKWIHSKGKPVSIKTLHNFSCCAPPIQELLTNFGKPKDLHNYKEIEVDNISIFIERHLLLNEKITLKLTGIGIFKTLTASLARESSTVL